MSVNQLLPTVDFGEQGAMNPQSFEGPDYGPIRESRVRAGGRSITLFRPADPDRLLDAPEVRARNAADDYMPYWAYLWPGAFLLGDAVAAGSWPKGLRTLEIGCGLGLPGLVALAHGLHVHFTDHDPTALRFVERNAQANGFEPANYSTGLLDWREPPPERYSLILGADVTYERRLVPLVARVIAAMLETDGIALISDPNRVASEGFGVALADLGLASEAKPAEAETDEQGPVRGTIYRVWRPHHG